MVLRRRQQGKGVVCQECTLCHVEIEMSEDEVDLVLGLRASSATSRATSGRSYSKGLWPLSTTFYSCEARHDPAYMRRSEGKGNMIYGLDEI